MIDISSQAINSHSTEFTNILALSHSRTDIARPTKRTRNKIADLEITPTLSFLELNRQEWCPSST